MCLASFPHFVNLFIDLFYQKYVDGYFFKVYINSWSLHDSHWHKHFSHCMIRVEILIDSIIMVIKELLSNGQTDIHFSALFQIILRGLYRI